MNTKMLGRIMATLIFALLMLCWSLTASAYDGGGNPAVAIRITPSASWTTQQAAVEIRITDNAGDGIQSAHVRLGGGGWREITGELEQTENRYYYVADMTENCTVHVRIAGQDGTIYEKSEYIQCFDSASDKRIPAEAQDPAAPDSAAPISPNALTPDGQGTVMDDVINGDGKEFFTFSTPDNNIFYLVIDRERESENVYFLNAVTESDLLVLAEKDEPQNAWGDVPDPEPVCICKAKCVPGEVNTDCPVCVLLYKNCTGIEVPVSNPDNADGQKPDRVESGGTILMMALAALAVGGAGYYLKIYKPKHDLDDAEDFDDLTGTDEHIFDEDEPDYPDSGEEPEDEE